MRRAPAPGGIHGPCGAPYPHYYARYLIVPTLLPRGNAVWAAPAARCATRRWSVDGGIPTPERHCHYVKAGTAKPWVPLAERSRSQGNPRRWSVRFDSAQRTANLMAVTPERGNDQFQGPRRKPLTASAVQGLTQPHRSLNARPESIDKPPTGAHSPPKLGHIAHGISTPFSERFSALRTQSSNTPWASWGIHTGLPLAGAGRRPSVARASRIKP